MTLWGFGFKGRSVAADKPLKVIAHPSKQPSATASTRHFDNFDIFDDIRKDHQALSHNVCLWLLIISNSGSFLFER